MHACVSHVVQPRASRNAKSCEPKRTDANQGFLPLDANDAAITACRSEAHAVRICLTLAERVLGRDQRTVAALCGWKSDSCLSEAASESHKRSIPRAKRERFALATGCNLLSQYLARKEDERLAAGRLTQADRDAAVAEKIMADLGFADLKARAA